jgi:hypothetical protein
MLGGRGLLSGGDGKGHCDYFGFLFWNFGDDIYDDFFYGNANNDPSFSLLFARPSICSLGGISDRCYPTASSHLP